jgi:uncharacterized protein YggE
MSTTLPTQVVAYLATLFVLSLAFTPALADPPLRKVTVTGTAIIKVVPDEMNWSVQVSITDSTLAKAKDRHDASLTAALAYIKGLGDAVQDLQTGGIRFDKNLYPGDDSFAKAHPFSCSTQFTFTLTDFDKYGPIADALSKLDGAQVQSVEYASSKEEATKRQALKQALLNAHDKASDLAVTAGCSIDKPLKIIEGTPDNGPRPMPMLMMARGSEGGTPPAVPGQIEIGGTVTATYDLHY